MKLDSKHLTGIEIKSTFNRYIYLKGSSHRIPKLILNNDFALFLGLLWGDGWVNTREKALVKGNWRIGLVEDDKSIIDVFSNLTQLIFNIKPHLYFRGTYYEVYFNSRIVYEILSQIFKFPDGDKINRLKIPRQIKNSNILLISFLQGLFSTDGKFVIDRGYPRIGVDSATKSFVEEIASILKQLGFNPRKYVWSRKNGSKLYGLYLNGKNQVKLFAQKINFVGHKSKLLEKYIKSIAPK